MCFGETILWLEPLWQWFWHVQAPLDHILSFHVQALKSHQKDGYNWLMSRATGQMGGASQGLQDFQSGLLQFSPEVRSKDNSSKKRAEPSQRVDRTLLIKAMARTENHGESYPILCFRLIPTCLQADQGNHMP